MRFILAAVAFAASVVALIIGGVQYAQAANVSEVTAAGSSDSAAPITVIGHDTLASRAGTQSLEITGEGDIVVVVGRTEDITAWVGDALHTTITLDEQADNGDGLTMGLEFTESGTETTVPSPVGNDLWFEEHTGEGTLSLDLVVSPGYSLLIASDGTAPAPGEIEISWPFGGYAPLVGPLLTAGAVLLVVAIVLLSWAVLHRRRLARETAVAAVPRSGAEPAAAAAASEDDASLGESGPQQDGQEPGQWSPVEWAGPLAPAEEDARAAQRVPVAELEPFAEPAAEPEPAIAPSSEPVVEPAVEPEPVAVEPEPVAAREPAAEPAVEPGHVVKPEPVAVEPEPVAAPEPAAERESEPEPAAEPASEPAAQPGPAAESGPASEPAAEPDPAAPAPEDDTKWRRPRGRNRSSAPKRRFFAAPLIAVTALTLAGCAPQYWPAEWTDTEIAPTGTPTSTVEAALIEEGASPPTLNDAQLAEVIADAAALAAEADETLDPSILEPRFTGDALQHRTALYEAQQLDAELTGPTAFPTGEVVYAIPEATDAWPRVVFAVVNPGEGAAEGASPAAIMLVQDDARENFKIASLTELAAGVSLPEAAPTTVGAPSIANLEGPLVLAPEEIAAAYADVLANGDESAYAASFDATNDALRAQVNDAYRESLTEELDPEVISISFAYSATDTAPIGITSIDGGAIVAVSIAETETLEAANDRALITVTGRTAVLSGVETSETGFERTYTDQLLFYVPSEQTGGTIQFLGVSQAMTDARVLEEEA